MKVPAKAKPIIYSGPMVIARNLGLKSQTRRPVSFENSTVLGGTSRVTWSKIDIDDTETYRDAGPDPFGRAGYEYLHARVRPKLRDEHGEAYRVRPRLHIGDLLWMREAHTITGFKRLAIGRIYRLTGFYNADQAPFSLCLTVAESKKFRRRKRKTGNIPPIFMYRSLCRGLDKITRIRVQRVQSISERDAVKEGTGACFVMNAGWPDYRHIRNGMCEVTQDSARMSFSTLWDSIHGMVAWKRNDWVWVYEFRPFTPRRRSKRWLDRRRGAKR